jgi:hypothetical protein
MTGNLQEITLIILNIGIATGRFESRPIVELDQFRGMACAECALNELSNIRNESCALAAVTMENTIF